MNVLFFLFIILCCICFFVFISNKKVTTRMRIFLTNKRVTYILAVYGIVLICSVIIMYTLPTNNEFAASKKISRNTFTKYSIALGDGDLNKIKSMHKQKEWLFNVNFQKLKININSYEFNKAILVKRKSKNDGKLKVVSYAFNYSTLRSGYYIDYTSQTKPPISQIKNSTLSLLLPSPYIITFLSFDNELSISQFAKENVHGIEFGGYNAVVLYIPHNMQIIDDTNTVRYVKSTPAPKKKE